jgi:uncharacterized protein (DUF1015 family)
VVELEPFGKSILPHERTHARAKADRLSLTRAVHANLSPIFSLYEDPSQDVLTIVQPALNEPPRLSIRSEDGDHHTVWSVADSKSFREIARVFEPSRLYVADGHHRYETALNFRDKMRLDHPEAPPDAAFNYVLMLLVDVNDPGLSILPTHRFIHDLEDFDAASLLGKLASRYRVSEQRDQATLLRAMQEPIDAHRIGLVLSKSASPSGAQNSFPSPVSGEGQGGGLSYFIIDIPLQKASDPVSGLDVSVLHREIIHGVLMLPETAVEEERHVGYWRDVDGVLDRVMTGAAQVAFLLRPPAVSDVVAVAAAGQVMPQKSTYFYPKPASGIVFNPLDPVLRIPAV